MTREEHIQHLKSRYEECKKAGDMKMADMFKQKFENMERGTNGNKHS